MAFSVSYIYELQDKYSAKLKKISRTTDKFQGKLRKTRESLSRTSQGFLNFSSVIGTVMGVMGGAKVAKTFMSFEKQMNIVRGVAKATDQDWAKLIARAKELGLTTIFTSSQVGGAMEMLGRNSMDATKILNGGIDATLKLAAATGGDLKLSADIMTDVMAVYKLKGKDLIGVVDQIAGTTVNAKFGIEDYRMALAASIKPAQFAGVSFKDLNSSIATMSESYASGQRLGTGFKTMLASMVPKTKDAAKIMDVLGINFHDGSGKMKDMVDVTAMLNKAFKPLTEKQKLFAGTTLFGREGLIAAFSLASKTAKDFNDVAGNISKVKAAKLAADRMRGLTGAVLKLQSALEGMQIKLLESGLAKTLESIAKSLTKITRAFSKASPSVLNFIGHVGLILAVIGPVMLSIGLFIQMIGGFAALVAAKIWVFAKIALVIGLILNPVGLVVAAFVGLIAATILVVKNWKTIVDFIKTSVVTAFTFWEEKILSVVGALKSMWDIAKQTTGLITGGLFNLPSKIIQSFTGGSVAADRAKATNSNLNGSIRVSADKGSKVSGAEMSTDMPGNLGFNMAGAG